MTEFVRIMRPGVAMVRRLLVTEYRHDQERRGLMPGSMVKMTCSLHGFTRWLAPVGLLDATEDDVQRFLDGKRICARTRYDWLSTLHCFYQWAIRSELTGHDPTARIVRPRLRRSLPRPIGDDDLAVALRLAGPVMAAWLYLAAYAGLRCAEIAGLTRDSILEGDRMLRILGKGAVERLVPLHPDVWVALQAAGLPRAGPVFRRRTGMPWDPAKVSRAISHYFDDIGIDATAHQLRHWFASRTYAACSDLRVVQELLGHQSPATTAIYTAFSSATATSAVFALGVK